MGVVSKGFVARLQGEAMKKNRPYLAPLAFALTALVHQASAAAKSDQNPATPLVPLIDATSADHQLQIAALPEGTRTTVGYEDGGDLFDFVLEKASDGSVIFAHRSHRSHSSHKSHRSHYSGR